MSKRDKLRQKLRNNPKGVKFSDLETLLLRFGFEKIRIKGSHHFYKLKLGDFEVVIVVPVHSNKVNGEYVKEAVQIIDELYPESPSQVDSEEEDESTD